MFLHYFVCHGSNRVAKLDTFFLDNNVFLRFLIKWYTFVLNLKAFVSQECVFVPITLGVGVVKSLVYVTWLDNFKPALTSAYMIYIHTLQKPILLC